jgi:hypothetical protein
MMISAITAAQNDTLEVHFLYGSRPQRGSQGEKRWFGGIHGGHVGVGSERQGIVNFFHTGRFHIFPHKKKRNAVFKAYGDSAFYAFHGSIPDSMKKFIVYIPVSVETMTRFDSIARAYVAQVPYDYAFFGMRCGAAAYEMLAQLDLVRRYSRTGTVLRIFYPRKLRKKLLALSQKYGWRTQRTDGSRSRRWEKD